MISGSEGREEDSIVGNVTVNTFPYPRTRTVGLEWTSVRMTMSRYLKIADNNGQKRLNKNFLFFNISLFCKDLNYLNVSASLSYRKI